jgi:hypothetical protein
MSISAAIAAPVEHKCGDRTYKFGKLTLEDWSAYCEHLQAVRLSQIAALDLPAHEKQQLYREVVREVIDTGVMFEHAMTLPGMRWLLHRSISKYHEEVDLEDVGGIVGGFEKMTNLVERIADLPEGDEGESDPPPAP